MSDIQPTNPSSTSAAVDIKTEQTETSQTPIQVEEPTINRQSDESSLIQEESISIFERAVRARDQLLSLTTPSDIINALVSETKTSADEIYENLSARFFKNSNDFDQHIMDFRNSILTANESLKAEETPITLKSAYEAYCHCRQTILKNSEATTFNWDAKGLTFFPPEIIHLTKMTAFSAMSNNLSSLPDGLFTLSTLRKISVNNNVISHLPPLNKVLENLTEFYMMSNRLEQIPQNITMLPNLQRLYIAENKLRDIPEELFTLRHLVSLHIGGNQLTALPANIDMLENLNMLTAWGNQLSSLPPAIANLKKLSKLYLNDNRFEAEPPEIAAIRPQLYDYNIALNPYNN